MSDRPTHHAGPPQAPPPHGPHGPQGRDGTPAPAGPDRAAKPTPPQQVVGAWQAWLATCVLQVVAAMTTLAINLLNPGALLELSNMGAGSAGAAFPELGTDEMLMVARVSAVITMFFTLAVAGVFAFLAFRMRAGGKWARLILVAGTAYLIVRMMTMFMGGPVGPWAEAPTALQLVDGALAIASATAAGAALVLASGRSAMEYFGAGGRDSGDGPGSSPGDDARRGRGKDGGHGR